MISQGIEYQSLDDHGEHPPSADRLTHIGVIAAQCLDSINADYRGGVFLLGRHPVIRLNYGVPFFLQGCLPI